MQVGQLIEQSSDLRWLEAGHAAVVVMALEGGARVATEKLHVAPVEQASIGAVAQESPAKAAQDGPRANVRASKPQPSTLLGQPEVVGAHRLASGDVQEQGIHHVAFEQDGPPQSLGRGGAGGIEIVDQHATQAQIDCQDSVPAQVPLAFPRAAQQDPHYRRIVAVRQIDYQVHQAGAVAALILQAEAEEIGHQHHGTYPSG